MRALPAALLAVIVPCVALAQRLVPPIDVAVTFSPRARELMQAKKEAVTVAVEFYGEPRRPGQISGATTDGFVHVGERSVTVPFASPLVVTITGARLDQRRLSALKPPVRLNVNVVSARRSSRSNRLDCGAYEAEMAAAARSGVSLACRLIGE